MSRIHSSVPLDGGTSTNIRVIGILPHDGAITDSLIHCKFHTLALSNTPAYAALSYQWGPPDEGHPIMLNGRPFSVRTNLWQFLSEARHRMEHHTALIWIDAICIDQEHTKERNHQVAMMGEIYSKASHVVVWLGPGTPVTAGLWGAHRPELVKLGRFPYHHENKDETVQAMKELAENAYWRRLWILQEFLLAENITIWCGPQSISENHFRYLLGEYIQECPATDVLQGRHTRQFSSSRMSFEDLIAVYGRILECSDKRDSIYALLSLLTDKERNRLDIVPDYSLTSVELLRQVLPKLHRNPDYKPPTTFDLCDALGLDVLDGEVQHILHDTEMISVKQYYTELTRRLHAPEETWQLMQYDLPIVMISPNDGRPKHFSDYMDIP
jgi:hypothetical protein